MTEIYRLSPFCPIAPFSQALIELHRSHLLLFARARIILVGLSLWFLPAKEE